jgi:DNA-binding PadR family transcriptional regulator
MSVAPKTANRTQILIKDLPFQEKYNLSHSQTDLMAYLVNVAYWAISVGEFYVITTGKIKSDLPAMGQKTIEASLKVLKDLGLIECSLVEVPQWNGNKKHRGVKLTSKGEEYNAKLVLPPQDDRVKALEKENKELRETIKRLTVSELEAPAPKQETKEKPITPSMPAPKAIEVFMAKVTKHFGKSSQPICNGVPKWKKESTFYINSYNKLSVITPEGTHKQIKNPLDVNLFWKWLSTHLT